VSAHVGAAGLTRHPSEQLAATPVGTFTLTKTFGGAPNTGHRITKMPYVQAKYGYAWGSDPSNRATYNRLYNCHCPAGEFYRLRQSYFRYALLIDYNTRPVVPGAGSGFFVHVTDGKPTAGCVTVPARELARILGWLDPTANPRISIRVR
jgi:L,D-peptidoglycan transpeptidase YkuD (ErfK/YbiS/YcfS/YnhG family)